MDSNDLASKAVDSKSQLGPVADSVVKISSSGQRGLRFLGIPILPQDPPGAIRLKPRFSVNMIKSTLHS